MHRTALVPACVLLAVLAVAGAARAANSDIVLEPDNIAIGFFYSGRTVHLRMETAQGDDIVVKVSGPSEDLHLKKKGKAGGILWMNVGEIGFENIPTLYILRSSRELDRMGAGDFLDKQQLGYSRIQYESTAASDKEEQSLFRELIKLKEKENLYSVDQRNVQHRTLSGGRQEITADFFIPANAPLGAYRVQVYRIADGRGVLAGEKEFSIEQTPPVAFLTSLARNNGLLYGCLAVIIAIVVGLITGLVFGMSKGKAH